MIRGACWAQRRCQAGWFLRRFSRVAKSGTAGPFVGKELFVRVFLSPNEEARQGLYTKCTTLPAFAQERIARTRKSRSITGNCVKLRGSSGRMAWVAHLVHGISCRSLSFGKFCWKNLFGPARKKQKPLLSSARASRGLWPPARTPCNPYNSRIQS